MSYALSGAVQRAIFERLAGDAALGAIVGGAVHDHVPGGTPVGTFVAIGQEDVRERSDASGDGALHDIWISVVSDAAGFATAKAAAGAVSDALAAPGLRLERGRLVTLNFFRARARVMRDGSSRRIDLRFRARVADDI